MSGIRSFLRSLWYSSEFKRNLKALSKKYRHIREDLQPVLEQIERGETPGDPIQGVRLALFKVRIANRDSAKGKSGGYRILYALMTPKEVILVTIYSKSEQGDVDRDKIKMILKEFGL